MPPKTMHVRANNAQMEMMVTYMECHQLFARGQITSLGRAGNEKYQLMWKELSAKLNELGRSQKDVNTWMNCWKRLRSGAKERIAKYLRSYEKTGNNNEDLTLNELDERIHNIFGVYGSGLSIIPEVGVPIDKNNSNNKSSLLNISDPSCTLDVMDVKLQFQNVKNQKLEIFEHCNREITRSIEKLQNVIERHVEQIERIFSSMSSSNRVRSTKAQHALLLFFMEKNQLFAQDILAFDETTKLWNELVDNLNAIGVEDRSVEAWKRTWHDKVRLTKEKKKDIEMNNKKITLTSVEERILKCIGEDIIYPLVSSPTTSTSDKESQASKRKAHSVDDNASTSKKRVLTPSTLQLAASNNDIISNLSNMLLECFQEQNKILKAGLEKLNINVSRLSADIAGDV